MSDNLFIRKYFVTMTHLIAQLPSSGGNRQNSGGNKQITEQDPNVVNWEIPPSVGVGVTSSTVFVFISWLAYDRIIKPRAFGWYSKLKRPYENMESIANLIQTSRDTTGADRAVLLELDTKKGTMIALSQEVIHAGVSKIIFSDKDNQVNCVRKILQRFNSDSFICRETELIPDDEYQGFLNNYGIAYVIYYKIGEANTTAWILSLHFSWQLHANYLAAINLKPQIKHACSSMLFLLRQGSPVDGLMK